jgi:hypothetical protein
MGLLTLEHSRGAYRADFAFYSAAAIVLMLADRWIACAGLGTPAHRRHAAIAVG